MIKIGISTIESHLRSNGKITTKNLRWFKRAEKVSEKSDFRIKVGCVAVLHGKIIATASNEEKSSPMQKYYNRYRSFDEDSGTINKNHAEMKCISKLEKIHNLDWEDVELYTFRKHADGTLGNSRCCEACERCIIDHGVHHIYYTDDCGYIYEWLNY